MRLAGMRRGGFHIRPYGLAKGSLCETDSPATGEVARSARGGALSAKLTEGESRAFIQSFG